LEHAPLTPVSEQFFEPFEKNSFFSLKSNTANVIKMHYLEQNTKSLHLIWLPIVLNFSNPNPAVLTGLS